MITYKSFILVLTYTLAVNTHDEGCNKLLKYRCPNSLKSSEPICVDSYDKCNPFLGCNDPSYPYLC